MISLVYLIAKRNFFGSSISALVVSFTAIIIVSGAVTAKSPELSVKVDDYGRIFVPVSLGDAERHFLFDAAAGRSLVSGNDAELLRLSIRETSNLRLHHSGGVLNVGIADQQMMSVAGRKINSPIVGVYFGHLPVEGVIGNSAFRGRVVYWSPSDHKLTLFAHAGAFSGTEWKNIVGRPTRFGRYLLNAEYSGINFDVILGTGVSHSTIDHKSAKRLSKVAGITRSYSEAIEAQGMFNDEGTPVELTIPSFAIGGWDLGALNVKIVRINHGHDLQAGPNSGVIVLGADILLRQEVAFDFRNIQFWVKAP